MRTSSTRRVSIAAAGLVLSALALGIGWLVSSVREREGSAREEQARLRHAAAIVRGAIDESLGE
ncbi:MAG: hypothetical protein AB7S26_26220, partial [Sandaracinaceae bacterium]